jgi:hypothetical protein
MPLVLLHLSTKNHFMKKIRILVLLGALAILCVPFTNAFSQSETCTADINGTKGHCSIVVANNVVVGFACDPNNTTGNLPCDH